MAKERRALGGKVVAITGGARGIGRATATSLVRKGCRVAIGDIDLPLAERTAEELGGGTLALPVDVTSRASFVDFLDEAERQLGPLDIVINNAGIMPVTPFAEESEESIHRQVDINLHGVITGTQLAIERMAPRNSGDIVNIASQAGKGGVPGIATYSATKHAVVGLTEAVRWELRGGGIEMHCVMPTVVNTELTSGVGQRWVKPVEAEDVANEIIDALEVGRYDVWIPKANGVLYRLVGLWPRSAREALGRMMKIDKLMTEVDHGTRNAYEERIAKGAAGEGRQAAGDEDQAKQAAGREAA
jgi:NAD(P)-dependent dehydrogenase (short-subunit alcohol dehydrogenase family)